MLRRLYQQQPGHAALLHLYHEAARIDPAADTYHEAANGLMQLRPDPDDMSSTALAVYREYLKLAAPRPRLKANTLIALLPLLLRSDELSEAERIVTQLARQTRRDVRLAPLISQLAAALHNAGDHQKGGQYQRLAETWSSPAS
jgi:hypothetical protein